ncbi:hypothetical protein [Pseudolysinimonas sp.]|jgi:hypothetical protein|uniref:hypothetical protein n=1 Tax=Pseudolysinimonas sp. TaxID=2680009 RepID=UPI003784DE71
MKRLSTAIALAVLAMLAVPSAAFAYGEPTGPNTVVTGGSGEYVFENIPIDITDVSVSIDGPGDAVLSGLVTRVYAVTGGTVTVKAIFPVTGTYTLTGTGTGAVSGTFTNSLSIAAIVRPADSGSLGATGVDAAPYLWFGGGAIILGVAVVLVLASGRRRREIPSRDRVTKA